MAGRSDTLHNLQLTNNRRRRVFRGQTWLVAVSAGRERAASDRIGFTWEGASGVGSNRVHMGGSERRRIES
eukprot:1059131-Prorocentrum_minimum.AAC.1